MHFYNKIIIQCIFIVKIIILCIFIIKSLSNAFL